MSRKITLLLSSCLLSSLCGNSAIADDSDWDRGLRGKFRLTGTGTCTESQDFTPPPSIVTVGGSINYHEVFSGTMTFDGRGRATQSIKGMTMFDGPIGAAISPFVTFTSECSYTYRMTGQLSFSQEGSCAGRLQNGPADGATTSVTNLAGEGVISRDGDMILITAVDPIKQSIFVGQEYQAKRYCIYSVTLIRAPRHQADGREK